MVIFGIRVTVLHALGALLVVAGLSAMMREEAGEVASACRPDDTSCAPATATTAPMRMAARALQASEACPNAGYLCAELTGAQPYTVRRWKNFTGTIVVHVPRPRHEAGQDAIDLQRAAAAGIRAWNNQPFPILVDTRGDREAHFAVEWTGSLGGSRIGVARTRWSPGGGLEVNSIALVTRNPYRPGSVADARQVRLTAAHEMGHALGLPHSDSSRDVMYPTNTATSVSAQDRRTMEMLYRLEDGTEIIR